MVLSTRSLATAAALLATAAQAASLEEVTDFGANPSGAKMHIYVPDAVAGAQDNGTGVPVVVAIHYCTGTGPGYYAGTPYAQLADEHGFIVVYPSSPHDGACWDVTSAEALQHYDSIDDGDGTKGSDSFSIAQMARHAVVARGGDAARVFVTGSSSGAMMTNVLAAAYPDVFAAAVSYSGVAAGCFRTGTVAGWNATCAQGQSVDSQAGWRDVALAMDPGYAGARPKMLILHGSADTAVLPEVSRDRARFPLLCSLFRTFSLAPPPMAGW